MITEDHNFAEETVESRWIEVEDPSTFKEGIESHRRLYDKLWNVLHQGGIASFAAFATLTLSPATYTRAKAEELLDEVKLGYKKGEAPGDWEGLRE